MVKRKRKTIKKEKVVRKRKRRTPLISKKEKKPKFTKKYEVGIFDPMLVIEGGKEEVFPANTIIKFKIKDKIYRAKIDTTEDALSISVLSTVATEACSILPRSANNFKIK